MYREAGPTSAADKYSLVLSLRLCCTGPNKSVRERPREEREEGRGREDERERGVQERGEGEGQGLE